jgi:ABC-2 type transport system permease protein
MNLWRLEWLRLRRTPRALTMAAVFVFFGLLQPILTKYQSQLLGHVGNGVRISFPPATPAAGVSGYFGELAGTGLIVVVVIAAGAFTLTPITAWRSSCAPGSPDSGSSSHRAGQ